MYKFKKSLIGLIGLLSLVAITTVITPHLGFGSGPTASAASSQTQNVNVVNTPTVSAQQNGPWNVGISGTPTVALDAVNNTVKIDSTNPVSLRDVDNAARQPFQFNASGNFTDGFAGTGPVPITQVPAGKRLIIEHVSVFGSTPLGQKLILASIGVTQQNANSGQPVLHYLVINSAGSDAFAARYSCSQMVRLYADPGTIVSLSAQRDATAGTLFGAVAYAISGYFINVP